MAGPSLEIKVDGASNFKDALRDLTRAVKQLDDTVLKAGRAISNVESDLGRGAASLASYQTLITSVVQEIEKTGKRLNDTAEGFRAMAKAQDELDTQKLGKVTGALIAVSDASQQMDVTGIVKLSTELTKLIGISPQIKSIAETTKAFFTLFQDKATAEITKAANAFARFNESLAGLKTFVDVANQIRGPTTNFINQLVTDLKLAETSLGNAGKTVITPLSRLLLQFRQFAKEAKSGTFDSIDRFFTEFTRSLRNLSSGPNIENLQAITSAIRSITSLLKSVKQDIDASDPRAAAEATQVLNDAFKRAVKFIKEVTAQIAELGQIRNPERLRAVSGAIRAIVEIIQELSNISAGKRIVATGGVNAQQIEFDGDRVFKLVNALIPLSKKLNKAVKQLGDIRAPANLRAASSAVRAVREIIETILDVSTQLFSNQNEAAIQQIQSRLNRFEGGGNVFARLTNTIARLRGRGGLAELLPNLQGLFKIIARSVREFEGIKEPGNIRAVGEALRGTGEFLQAMSIALEDIVVINPSIFQRAGNFLLRRGGLTETFNRLPNVFKILARAIEQITSIKVKNIRVSDLAGIGNFLQGVAKVLPQLEQIGSVKGFKRDTLRQLSPALRGLVEDFAKLSRSIDDKTLARLDKLSNATQRLGNTLEKASAALASGSSSKEIARSFERLGKAATDGFEKGLIDSKEFVDAGRKAGRDAIKGAEKELGVSSPSRVFKRIATDVVRGFEIGIQGAQLAALGAKVGFSFANAFIGSVRRIGDETTRLLQDTSRSINNVADNLIRSGITRITTGGLAGFLQGRAVSLAANFDQILNQIKIFGRLSTEQLQSVQQELLSFSAATIFAPQQAADAFLGLQKAGLDTVEALTALPDIGNLAAAGQLDLASATDLAIRSLAGFGLEVEDLSTVVDIFVGGADISTAAVSDLAQAIGFVGPSARAMNISLSQTTTALALLNDRGIAAERAGTGLRALLSSIAAPTEQAKNSLETLGIELSDLTDEAGNFLEFNEILQLFADGVQRLRSTEGVTEQDIFQTLAGLGDRNAISALLTLVETTEEGTLAFEEYQEALLGANSAQTVATGLMDTFQGSVTSLRGSVDTLIITALTPLLNNVLKPIVQQLINVVNALASVDPAILSAAAGVALLVTAFVTLSGVTRLLAGLMLKQLVPALSLVSNASRLLFNFIFNPRVIFARLGALAALFATAIPLMIAFAAVVGTLAAVVGIAAVVINKDFGGAGESFKRLLEDISSLASELGDTLSLLVSIFQGLFNALSGSAVAGTGFGAVLAGIGRIVSGVIESLRGFVNGIREIIGAVNELLTVVQDALIIGGFLEAPEPEGPTASERIRTEREAIQAEIDALNEQIAEATANTGEITIQAGDTLFDLAQEYGTTVDELVELNNIADRNFIRTGDTLQIPGIGEGTEDIAALNEELERQQIALADLEQEQAIAELIGFDDMESDARQAQQELERVTGFQERMIALLDNPIVGSIVGRIFPEADLISAVNLVGVIEEEVNKLTTALEFAGSGFKLFASGEQEAGMRRIEVAVGAISLQFFSLLRVLTGFDIGEEVKNALTVGDLKGAITSIFKRVFRAVEDFLVVTAREAIIGSILRAFNVSSFILVNIGDFILRVIGVDGLRETLGPLAGEISETLELVLNQAFGLLAGEDIESTRFANNIIDGVSNALSKVRDFIRGDITISDVGQALLGFVIRTLRLDDLFEAVRNAILGIDYRQIGEDIVDGLLSGIGSLFDLAIGLIEDFIEGVKDALGISSPSTVFVGIGEDIIAGLLSAFSGLGQELLDLFKNAIQFVADNLPGFASGALSGALGFAEGVANTTKVGLLSLLGIEEEDFAFLDENITGLEDSIDELKSAFDELAQNPVITGIGDVLSAGFNTAKDAVTGLKDTFTDLLVSVGILSGGDEEAALTGQPQPVGPGGLEGVFAGIPLAQAEEAPFLIKAIGTAIDGLALAIGALGSAISFVDDFLRFVSALANSQIVVAAFNAVFSALVTVFQIGAAIFGPVISDLSEALSEVAGVFDIVQQNIDELTVEVDNLVIGFLLLIGPISGAVGGLASLLGISFPLLGGFGGLGAILSGVLIPALIAVGGFLLNTVLIPFTLIIFAINLVKRGLEPLIDTFFSLIEVIDAVGGVVTAIIDFFITLFGVFTGENSLSDLGDAFLNIFGAVGNVIKEVIGLMNNLSRVYAAVVLAVIDTIDTIGSILGGLIEVLGLGDFFQGLAEGLLAVFPQLEGLAPLLDFFRDLFNILTSEGLFGAIGNLISRAVEIGSLVIQAIITGLRIGISVIQNFFRGIFERAWQAILRFFRIGSPSLLALELGINIVKGFIAGFQALPGLLLRVFISAFSTIIKALPSVIAFIRGPAARLVGNLFTSLFNAVSGIDLSSLVSIGLAIITSLGQTLEAVAPQAAALFANFFANLFDSIGLVDRDDFLAGLQVLGEGLLNFFGTIKEIFADGFQFSDIGAIFNALIDPLKNISSEQILTTLNVFKDIVKGAVGGLLKGIFSLANLLGLEVDTEGATTAVNQLIDTIFAGFGQIAEGNISGALETFKGLVQTAATGLLSGVFSLANLLGLEINEEATTSAVTQIIDKLFEGFQNIAEGDFTDALGNFQEVASTALKGVLSGALGIANLLGLDVDPAAAEAGNQIIDQYLDKVFGFIENLSTGSFDDIVSSFKDTAAAAFKGVWTGVFNLANLLGLNVGDAATADQIATAVTDFLFAPLEALTAGTGEAGGPLEAIKTIFDNGLTSVQTFFGAIGDGVNSVVGYISRIGTGLEILINNIEIAILQVVASTLATLEDATNELIDIINKGPFGDDIDPAELDQGITERLEQQRREGRALDLELAIKEGEVDKIIADLQAQLDAGDINFDQFIGGLAEAGIEDVNLQFIEQLGNVLSRADQDEATANIAQFGVDSLFGALATAEASGEDVDQLKANLITQLLEGGFDIPIEFRTQLRDQLLDAILGGAEVDAESLETSLGTDFVEGLFGDIETAIEEGEVAPSDLGQTVVQGFADGLGDNEAIQSAAQEMVDQLKATIEGPEGLNSQSPSLWADSVAQDVIAGFVQGFLFAQPLLDITLNALIAHFRRVGTEVTLMSVLIGSRTFQAASEYVAAQQIVSLASAQMSISFANTSEAARQLIERLGMLIDAAREAASAMGQVDGATVPPPVPPGRRFGGPVLAGRLYEINERTGGVPIPEVFRTQGRTFLLPGSSGVVQPLAGSPGGAVVNQNVINYITIQVPEGVTEIDPEHIARGMELYYERNQPQRDLRNND